MAQEYDESLVVSSPTREETPVRAVVCLKRKEDVKRFEETEECFILDFDPFDSLDISKLSLKDNKNNHDDNDISIIAEKGQVSICNSHSPYKTHRYCFLGFKYTLVSVNVALF